MNTKTKQFNKEFEKIKRSIFCRDQFKCQIEGEHEGSLDIDHIIPRSLKGGSNDPQNLIVLCRYHHTLFHLEAMAKKIKQLREILHRKYGYEYNDRFEPVDN